MSNFSTHQNFAAATVNARDYPPIKLNFGVSIGHFIYFQEKLCCSCYWRYTSTTDHSEFWSFNWTHFIIYKKICAAAAIDATDHSLNQTELWSLNLTHFGFRGKFLLHLLWMLQIVHQSNWTLEFQLDTFFSISKKIFAAAAVDTTDHPPIQLNLGV